MYNVIIIDDEKYVTKSIELSIPWSKLHLNLKAIAHTALEALEIIKKEPIDIMITDIQMPGMSGLDLCQTLMQMNPLMQVIIISGHADFTYAQRAFSYNTVGYCLKPIDYDELTGYLKKAVARYQTSNTHEIDFIDILEEKDITQLHDFIVNAGYSPDKIYVAASINLPCLQTAFQGAMVIKLGLNKYVYLSKEPLDEISTLSFHQLGGIGYNENPTSVTNLRKVIMDCYTKSYQYFIEGRFYVCKSIPTRGSFPMLAQVTQHLKSENTKALLSTIKEIQETENLGLYDIRFAFTLYTLIYTSQLLDSKVEEPDSASYDFDQLVTEFSTFESMLDTIRNTIHSISQDQPPMENKLNTNFLQIMKYINANFTKSLSLQSIADELHLNPNYISQLFKKETHTTYVKYLTKLRIEYAKKLLETTDLPINVICEQAGFNDYFYFLKAFKKATNISPSKFRSYTP